MSADLGQGLILLAVGAVGGISARVIGVPAGMIVGAALTSGIYRLAGAIQTRGEDATDG